MAGTTLTMGVTVSGASGITIDPTAGSYTLVEAGMSQGAKAYRRVYAESQWVPGRALVSAVADIQVGRIVFRVFGTLTEQKTRIDALEAAFSQFSYDTTITVDGQALVWSNCEPADMKAGTLDGNWSGPHWMAGQQNVEFQVPHDPGWG